jgi:hypothetical protein
VTRAARVFLARLGVVQFESMIGAFAAYSAVVGLLRFGVVSDALDELFPTWATDAFSTAYLAAGVLILLGIGRQSARLEILGLWLVATSVVIRGTAIVGLLGLTAISANTVVFNLLVIAACASRIRSLLRGDTTAKLERRGT